MTTRASILLVDDSPEKLMTLSAVLEGLAEDVVTARSGREALRLVLNREFAVILLDVRMPDMDGFETAGLIRQRPSSEHTPIIFLTALDDVEFSATGYALGAVDFITTPVRPEVLRSKVGVFLDLFKKARQISRQAEALRRRAEQLHQLSRASLAINGALSLAAMLDVATSFSRELVGADEAVTLAYLEPGAMRLMSAVSLADAGPHDRRRALEEAAAFTSHLPAEQKALRFSAEEFAGPDRAARSRLAAPLTGRDGRNMGWLAVAGGFPRTFSAEDESLLTQLAQVTSIALENTLISEAREANRLKDEFLTTLSHELRTPLTAILGWVRLLKGAKASPSAGQLAHGLAVIERNVKVQARLIEDLLDVSRIIAGKLSLDPGEVVPASVARAVLDAMLPAAEAKGIALTLHVASEVEEMPPMAGDADRLQQVVWNLVTNALKFTPKGGHVEVRMERPDERLRITVKDDGRGISPGFIKHVFDRFRQADSSTTRSQGGLGIGLALVRHIAELHGGGVSVESPGLDRGATFTVSLPVLPPGPRLSRPVLAEGPSRSFDAGQPTLEGISILVVDDEPDAREVLREILRGAGAHVETAGSTEEALQRVCDESYDLLVSDIGMPVADGIALIRSVRSSNAATVPALAVTAYAREEERNQAIEAGFDAHLVKPLEPADLIRTAGELTRATRFRRRPPSSARIPAPAQVAPEPVASEPVASTVDTTVAPDPPASCGRRVLLIEDSADTREALKELLELDGHLVEVSGSGTEGVEIAVKERPDVALVDLGLPDLDGHEVARRLRAALGPCIRLLALTGHAGAEARARALEAGFDDHIAKPVDFDRLHALIRKRD